MSLVSPGRGPFDNSWLVLLNEEMPENFDDSSLRAVYEDEWLLVVNKPAGLAVQPELERLVRERWGERLVAYHRLDKDTSGLIIFGKRPEIHRAMGEAFEKKRIRKSYFAIVRGAWQPAWNRVETFVDRASDGRMANLSEAATPSARRALTTFRLLARTPDGTAEALSWIEAMPKTGRTHQIRLHCLAKGCPILGDVLYGPEALQAASDEARNVARDVARDVAIEKTGRRSAERRLALHAYRLDFSHPKTGVKLHLTAPPPRIWQSWLEPFGVEEKLTRLLVSAP